MDKKCLMKYTHMVMGVLICVCEVKWKQEHVYAFRSTIKVPATGTHKEQRQQKQTQVSLHRCEDAAYACRDSAVCT